jgi:hypothetical protein
MLHLAVEQLAVNAEEPRRLCPIAGRSRERAADQHLLKARGRGVQIFVRPVDRARPGSLRLIDEVEIGRMHEVAAHQDGCAFHRVLQLPHIAGPSMANEARRRIGRKPLAGLGEKMLGERDDVGNALAQRRPAGELAFAFDGLAAMMR